ncbi:uncharacterized protein LOC116615392 [Nematostella vectensis]|uniref:uncharacterized protein LOC116615392 n=1 Tax=Nematostella vectensis TaxID=45351 RepID=UPI002076FEB1|nr:uncharacterized protein LOC116615392 [Nematostella vectensis]
MLIPSRETRPKMEGNHANFTAEAKKIAACVGCVGSTFLFCVLYTTNGLGGGIFAAFPSTLLLFFQITSALLLALAFGFSVYMLYEWALDDESWSFEAWKDRTKEARRLYFTRKYGHFVST